mmetsp:Transcript_1302/g.1412  ORF Transcript_1302/g.1412 Transcript_1302/m.1412 type:complete len:378 (-) Transcript_1302:1455-2588(-)
MEGQKNSRNPYQMSQQSVIMAEPVAEFESRNIPVAATLTPSAPPYVGTEYSVSRHQTTPSRATTSAGVNIRVRKSSPEAVTDGCYCRTGCETQELNRQDSYEIQIEDQNVVVHLNSGSENASRGYARDDGYSRKEEEPTQDWLFEGRLLRVKGNESNIVLKEVKCRMDSMNSGDVFILDTALNLYLWNGKDSNFHEREKALVFTQNVVKARSGRTKLIVLDEGTNDDCPPFWNKIQGKKKVMGMVVKRYNIKTEEEGGSDHKHVAFRKKMYRLTDRSGELKFTLCTKGNMSKDNMVNWRKLDSDDVFILDDGFKIWVWVGRRTSEREKAACLSYAAKYVKRYNRPTTLPIQKIEEGYEPKDFIENFGHFQESNCSIS